MDRRSKSGVNSRSQLTRLALLIGADFSRTTGRYSPLSPNVVWPGVAGSRIRWGLKSKKRIDLCQATWVACCARRSASPYELRILRQARQHGVRFSTWTGRERGLRTVQAWIINDLRRIDLFRIDPQRFVRSIRSLRDGRRSESGISSQHQRPTRENRAASQLQEKSASEAALESWKERVLASLSDWLPTSLLLAAGDLREPHGRRHAGIGTRRG